ncbi:MAG: hypothetical protein WDO74_24510 [Pseudomonadota bacterium]
MAAALYLNPPEGGVPLKLGARLTDFGFDTWGQKEPDIAVFSAGDVQVADGRALTPGAGDRVLGASDQGPILVSGARSGHRFVALGFDPRNSDLVLRVAWPLFVLNAINAFVEEDTGYVLFLPHRRGVAHPRTELGRFSDRERSARRAARRAGEGGPRRVSGEEAGFYKLSAGSGSGAVSSEFAANLSDLAESRITPVTELSIGRQKRRQSASAPPARSTSCGCICWQRYLDCP